MAEFKRNLAVVIGINQYINGIPTLKTAVNDAQELAKILQEKHQYQVLLLVDEAATMAKLSTLTTAFEQQTLPLADGSKITIHEDDRVLFYFAGHGIALEGFDNINSLAGFLVPQDAKMDTRSGLLSMTRLHDSLQQLPCRHLLVILDCCFAGTFRWAGQPREAVRSQTIYRERYERFMSGYAQQVITSAAHDETAADYLYQFGKRDNQDEHSPFAELLFKALCGDGDLTKDAVITATEIYVYIHSEIAKTNARQTPGFSQLRRHDKGEFVFFIPGFDPKKLAQSPALTESNNPYRGLESFEEQHSKLFFGRKALIEKLDKFIVNQPLTVVLSASGSGKSSLVKAGLIPQLRNRGAAPLRADGEGCMKWRILAPVRLGECPFTALNNTLTQENLPSFTPSGAGFEEELLTLYQSVKAWSKANRGVKLLLVIEQFEELFTLCRNQRVREKFLSGLARAIKAFPKELRIVVTLRNDFEPQFRNTPLEPYWSRFIVPGMTREQLREVILEPAHARVMYFEPPSLVEELIDEVAQMPGALPLLSFTLSELYRKYLASARAGERNNRAITQEDYLALGGVTRSLTQRADKEYDELVHLEPAYAHTIKHVMLRMVAVGGGELARRRVLSTELEYPQPEQGRVKLVIERFIAARLLVKGRDTENQEYIEPAHDALVRGWQRLRNWQEQESPNLLLQRELTQGANQWAKQKQNQKAAGLLWDDYIRLPLLQQLVESDKNWLNAIELEFFQCSLQRRRNKRRRLISYVAGVILALSGISTFAVYQSQVAQKEEIKTLITLSESQRLSNNQLLALQTILKTSKKLQHTPWVDKQLTQQVLRNFRQQVYNIQERNRLEVPGEPTPVISLSFSQDGKTIATASKDGTVKIWNLNSQLLHSFKAHNDEVLSISFSQDGKTIATASKDKTVKLWNREAQLLHTLQGHNDWVWDVSFSPDGKTIATASKDKTVKLWNRDAQLLKSFIAHNNAVLSISWNPDGKTIATASQDKTVKLWNRDAQLLHTLKGHNSWVWDVSFSPDGKTIATADEDGIAKLWNRDGQKLITWQAHNDALKSISFSPDGKTIATASDDGTTKLWNLEGKKLTTLQGHQKQLSSVRFSHDGKTLATSSSDGTVKLWSLNSQPLKTILKGHEQLVTDVSFSPDGKTIATASADKTVKLWNLNTHMSKTIGEHRDRVSKVRFSRDGKIIASASWDGTVKLWHRDGKPIGILMVSQDGVSSVSFSPDGKTIATASRDGTAKLWNLNAQELQTLKGHNKQLRDISFSPDGKTIATASLDGTVQLWNLNAQKLQTLRVDSGEVFSVSFSPDGKTIATAHEDGTAKIWHQGAKGVQTLRGHSNAVLSVSFSPVAEGYARRAIGKTIATASLDGTVKLWSLEGEELQTLRGYAGDVLSVSFSPVAEGYARRAIGKTIATANLNSSVILWQLDVELEQLQQIGCNWLRDYLMHNPNVSPSDSNLCHSKSEN
jgi:WD40 repeat protein